MTGNGLEYERDVTRWWTYVQFVTIENIWIVQGITRNYFNDTKAIVIMIHSSVNSNVSCRWACSEEIMCNWMCSWRARDWRWRAETWFEKSMQIFRNNDRERSANERAGNEKRDYSLQWIRFLLIVFFSCWKWIILKRRGRACLFAKVVWWRGKLFDYPHYNQRYALEIDDFNEISQIKWETWITEEIICRIDLASHIEVILVSISKTATIKSKNTKIKQRNIKSTIKT